MNRFSAVQTLQTARFLAFLFARHSIACQASRTIWMKPRSPSFLTDIAGNWSDREWKQNFRVSRATFNFLCRELKCFLERQHVVREPLSTEQRIAICLWRLGTNVDYRTISHLFGVGVSTVCVVLHDFCCAVVTHMAAKYIKVPTGPQLRKITDGFYTKWGFPQCIGAIDGSHIPIIAPKENPLDYYNRKGYHSVLLQALVDHEYRFLDVYVGWPGSVHDARVLANSGLYRKCESGNFLPNWIRTLNNASVPVPLVVLGDPTYPLRLWLMKPFSDSGLTSRQKKFNYQLSRSRVVVENAFGRLKGRWRSLMKRNDNDIKYVPNMVTACCVLHNLCEMHGDLCEEDWVIVDPNLQTPETSSTSSTSSATSAQSSGSVIREALCDYFDAL